MVSFLISCFCLSLNSLTIFFLENAFIVYIWMVQGSPVNIIVGSHVWAEDPEDAWIDGEVIEISGRSATIITTNGKTVSFSDLPYSWT